MSTVFPFVRGILRRAADSPRARPAVLVLAGGALLLLLGVFAALRTSGDTKGEFVVRRGTLDPSVPLVGTLSAARSDAYGAIVPGVEQAEAAARLAAIRLEEANRQMAEAQKKIGWCTVTARAPGLAVHSEVFDRAGERRKFRVGDSVWGGTIVVTLPDLTRMTINGRVPEPEMHHLASNQPVRVALDAFPERNLTGVLRSIGSVGASEKNESRSFPVTISLDQTDSRFRPGMVARCSIRGERISDALFIPVEAVGSDESGTFARVISAFGSTRTRRITLGRSTAQFVEVRDGLRTGERVRIGDAD